MTRDGSTVRDRLHGRRVASPRPQVGRTSRRPAGADNFLRWRRSVSEHLESGRLQWPEYGMLNWLCTKAGPYTGTLRTSWPALAVQTGLSPAYVARLCRSLRRKRYVFYADHRGRRDGLVEMAIDKFPLPGELYTDLSDCFPPDSAAPGVATDHHRGVPGGRAPEAPTDGPMDAPTEQAADVLTDARIDVRPEVGSDPSRQPPENLWDSTPLRRREVEKKESLRGRAAPAPPTAWAGESLDRETALAWAPPALRETLDLYCYRTGRARVSRADLDWLARLDRTHTPAVIQKAISTAVARARARGRSPATVTLAYVGASLQHFTSRRAANAAPPVAARRHPPGVTRLEQPAEPR